MKREGNSISFCCRCCPQYRHRLVELLPLSHLRCFAYCRMYCNCTTKLVEYITLHMGSANNCVFRCIPFFRTSSFNMDNAFFVSEAICDGSVGKDQSCFGKNKKILVSMICKCRRILWGVFSRFFPVIFFPFSVFPFFFYLRTKTRK